MWIIFYDFDRVELSRNREATRNVQREHRGRTNTVDTALPVAVVAAALRTIRVDSGIEADKPTRYDMVHEKDKTRAVKARRVL